MQQVSVPDNSAFVRFALKRVLRREAIGAQGPGAARGARLWAKGQEVISQP